MIKTELSEEAKEFLRSVEKFYIWWDDGERDYHRIAAQVMNFEDYEDNMKLLKLAGKEYLKELIKNAKPGWFTKYSWGYWHYILDLSSRYEDIPPLPRRIIDGIML